MAKGVETEKLVGTIGAGLPTEQEIVQFLDSNGVGKSPMITRATGEKTVVWRGQGVSVDLQEIIGAQRTGCLINQNGFNSVLFIKGGVVVEQFDSRQSKMNI